MSKPARHSDATYTPGQPVWFRGTTAVWPCTVEDRLSHRGYFVTVDHGDDRFATGQRLWCTPDALAPRLPGVPAPKPRSF